MGWKGVTVMDQRVRFIAEYLKGYFPFNEVCLQFSISRKTGYKWVERYELSGSEGLAELPLQTHLAGHIPLNGHVVHNIPRCIPDRGDPHVRLIGCGALHRVDETPSPECSPPYRVPQLLVQRLVFPLDPEKRHGLTDKSFLRAAPELREHLVDVKDAALSVSDHDTLEILLDRGGEPDEFGLGLFPPCDVLDHTFIKRYRAVTIPLPPAR